MAVLQNVNHTMLSLYKYIRKAIHSWHAHLS